MRLQTFGTRKSCDGGGETPEGIGGQLLDGDYFDEVGRGEAAANASRAGGRQDMIGAGGVIAGRFGTRWAEEHAARVLNFREERGVFEGEMLGRKLIGSLDRSIQRRA